MEGNNTADGVSLFDFVNNAKLNEQYQVKVYNIHFALMQNEPKDQEKSMLSAHKKRLKHAR